MDVYRLKGKFRMGTEIMPFTKEFFAESEEEAREKLLCDLGSKHKTKRRDINISEVKKIKVEEITDTHLRKLMEELK